MLGKNLRNAVLGISIEYKNSYQFNVPVFNSNLKNSIKQKPTEDGFYIEAFNYFDFLDKGVSGSPNANNPSSIFQYDTPFSYKTKKPRLDQGLGDWAKAKGINKFAVQQSIFRKGIVPRLITKQVQEQLDRGRGIKDRLNEGFLKDIDEEFKDNK
jgi:hypothetical protein